MFEEETELVERVRKESDEFDKLFTEHQTLEKKLEEYTRIRYLNTQEEQEKKKLQKIKLAGKDRMAAILQGYRKENLC